jgi:hypothetical protein
MNLQKLISQTDFSLEDLKTIVTQKGLTIKEWNDRILITYNTYNNNPSQASQASQASQQQVDLSDPIVNECCGIILDKSDNKKLTIVCHSMNKLKDSSELSTDELKTIFDQQDGITEELYDGSLIKLYYYQDQWAVSTKRCIEARKARWANYRTFFEMFQEAIGSNFDYDTLDKRNCYSFVLCHPENRIVVNYTTPEVMHISTRSLDTLEEIACDIPGIEHPLQLKMDWDTFQERLTTNPYYMPGYVLKSGDQRIVFESVKYQAVKELKGNAQDLVYRYLQLKRENENEFDEFNNYFPEYKWVDSQLETLAREAHRSYMEYFVNHDKTRITQRDLWELMIELHTLYIRTQEPTSLVKVRQHLKSYPLDKLTRLIKMK